MAISSLGATESGVSSRTKLNLAIVEANRVDGISTRAPLRTHILTREGDALILDQTTPGIDALDGWHLLYVTAQHTNTGPVTLKIADLETVPVLNSSGQELAAGEWRSGRFYLLKTWIVGETKQFRIVSENVLPADVANAVAAASTATGLAEQIGIDQIVKTRGWNLRPRLGMYAIPNAPVAGMTVTRSGSATRLNEAGRLEVVPANSMIHAFDEAGEYLGWQVQPPKALASLWTADFIQSYWTKTRVTVSADAVVGPNLSGLADRVLETVEDGTHGVGRLTGNADLVSGSRVWVECLIKESGRRYVVIAIDGSGYAPRSIGLDLETGEQYGPPHADFIQVDVRKITQGTFAGYVHVSATLGVIQDVTAVRYYMQSRESIGVSSYVGDITKGYDLAAFAWGAGNFVPGYLESAEEAASRGLPTVSAPETLEMPEGTLYCEFIVNSLPVAPTLLRVASFFATENNRIQISISTTGNLYATVVLNAAGVSVPNGDPANLPVEIGRRYRAAISWRNGKQLLAVDGRVFSVVGNVSEYLLGEPELVVAKHSPGATVVADVDVTETFVFGPMSEDELSILTGQIEPGEVGYAVDCAYAEVATDPSTDMYLTWIAGATHLPAAEYRVAGATTWMSAGAVKRAFPETEKSVFTAKIERLSPDTIYEWRPAGSGDDKIRRFRTAPSYLSRDLRLAAVSDWQRDAANAGDPASDFNTLNSHIGSYAPDVVLFVGDYVADNGATSAALSTLWIDFINGWSKHMVDADGCLPPIAAIAGNHEASAVSNPAGGSWDGTGTYGYMDKLFSTFYRQEFANVGGVGFGWFEIGTELLCVGLETNHATPILDQIQWLDDLLTAKAASYRHVVVMGHFGVVSAQASNWTWDGHRVMREKIAPIVQAYPNAKFMISAHDHILMATRRVKFVADPAGGVNAWSEAADGIRVIGAGGWGSPSSLDFDNQDQASDAVLGDGSVLVEYFVSSNQAPRGVTPISAPNNTSTDPATRHFWTLDLKAADIEARAINLEGGVYVDITESVA